MNLTLAGAAYDVNNKRLQVLKGTCGKRHPLFLSSGDSLFEAIEIWKHPLTSTFRSVFPQCQRFLTPDDTHKMCVICLGEDHACSVSEGAECAACENFSIRKHCSCLSLFFEGIRTSIGA